MAGAFQSDAFQNDAFQVDAGSSVTRSATDSLTSSESLTRTGVFTRSASQTITTSDVATVNARYAVESITTSDVATRAASLHKTTTESPTTSDTATRSQVLSRTVTQTVTATDAAVFASTKNRSTSEAISTSDVATRVAALTRSATQTVTASDAATRALPQSRTTADSITASLSASQTVTIARTTTDSVTASVAVTLAKVLVRDTFENTLITDAAVTSHAFFTTTDSMVASDVATRSAALVRSATESITASCVAIKGQSKTVAQTITASLVATRSAVLSRTTSESVSGSDVAINHSTPDVVGPAVYVDGINVTVAVGAGSVLYETARFMSAVNGVAGEASLRIRDDLGVLTYTPGQSLELIIDSQRVWTGFITNVKRVYAFPALNIDAFGPTRFFDIEGTDLNILLTKRIVFNQSTPANVLAPLYGPNTPDVNVIAELFENWLDLSGDNIDTSTGVTAVATINEDQNARPWEGSDTWGQAMQSIAAIPAAIYYIRPNFEFAYVDTDTPDAPFALTDVRVSSGGGGGTVTATDDFNRTEAVGFGTGPLGTWVTASGTLSVGSGHGIADTVTTQASAHVLLPVLTVDTTNVTVEAQFTWPSVLDPSAVLEIDIYSQPGFAYDLFMIVNQAGSMDVDWISPTGFGFDLQPSGFIPVADAVWNLKLDWDGASLMATAWPNSTSEPLPQVTLTGIDFAPADMTGTPSFFVFMQSSNDRTFFVDNATISTTTGTPVPPDDFHGYREMEILADGTNLANDVLAWGAGYGSNIPVFTRAGDATSQTEHGLWQIGQTTFGVYKQSTINRIADSILNGSPEHHRGAKDDRPAVTIVTYERGLLPAQKVDFTSEVFGYNDVLPIRKMEVTFPAPDAPRYQLTLSHEIDTPWSFFDPFRYHLPALPGVQPPRFPPPVVIPPTTCQPTGGTTCTTNLLSEDDYSTDWFEISSEGTFSQAGNYIYASIPANDGTVNFTSELAIRGFFDVPRATVEAGLVVNYTFGYTASSDDPGLNMVWDGRVQVQGSNSTRRRGKVSQDVGENPTPPYRLLTLQQLLTGELKVPVTVNPGTPYTFSQMISSTAGFSKLVQTSDTVTLGAPTIGAGDPLTIQLDMQVLVSSQFGFPAVAGEVWMGVPTFFDLDGNPIELSPWQVCSAAGEDISGSFDNFEDRSLPLTNGVISPGNDAWGLTSLNGYQWGCIAGNTPRDFGVISGSGVTSGVYGSTASASEAFGARMTQGPFVSADDWFVTIKYRFPNAPEPTTGTYRETFSIIGDGPVSPTVKFSVAVGNCPDDSPANTWMLFKFSWEPSGNLYRWKRWHSGSNEPATWDDTVSGISIDMETDRFVITGALGISVDSGNNFVAQPGRPLVQIDWVGFNEDEAPVSCTLPEVPLPGGPLFGDFTETLNHLSDTLMQITRQFNEGTLRLSVGSPGLLLTPTTDYTVNTTTGVVTLTAPVAADTVVSATYVATGPLPIASSGDFPPDRPSSSLLTTWGTTPALPAYLVPITDAYWDTRITRVSNINGKRQTYPRIPGWNSDQTKLMLGFDYQSRMLNGTTLVDLGAFPQINGFIWSNVDPNKGYGWDSSGSKFYSQNATTGALTVLRDFIGDGFPVITIGDYEGAVSDDDQWVALIGTTPSSAKYLITYNIQTNTILATTPAPSGIDNCQISRLGNYVTVGAGGDTRRYLRDLSSSIILTPTQNHGDNALDGNGNEIWVGNNCPHVVSFRLQNGAATQLLPNGDAYEYGHISGRCFQRPGWIYTSVYDNVTTNGRYGVDQIIAVKTDGSGTVNVFGYGNNHHSGSVYASQTQALASPDGKRVVFASTWSNSPFDPVYAYVAEATP